MKPQPPVTIIIPTYNRANYLREALQSALAQTYQNLEVLVFDDASPDNTSSVVAEFSADPRLSYMRNQSNLGIIGNWQTAIKAATGDFFCILHDDDTLEPGFIESLLSPLLNDEKLILSCCDVWEMNERGLRLTKESEESSLRWKRNELKQERLEDFVYSAAIDQSIPIGATLFRRSLVKPEFVSEQAQGAIDIWFIYQCAKTGYGAYYIPKRLMNYRAHSEGMSQSGRWRQYSVEGDLFRYEQILTDPTMSRIHKSIQAKKAVALYIYGTTLLASGQHRAAYHVLKKSLQLKLRSKTLVVYGMASLGSLGTQIVLMLYKLRERRV